MYITPHNEEALKEPRKKLEEWSTSKESQNKVDDQQDSLVSPAGGDEHKNLFHFIYLSFTV